MDALQTEFDEQARERIRRALRRYMEEHRIGTPTLQLRIMTADEPRRRELPLSTLQRFLTGAHRTADAYVGMCLRFLESSGASLALPDFGEALVSFLRQPVAETENPVASADLLESLAGEYLAYTWHAPSKRREIPRDDPDHADSHATLRAVSGKQFLLVEETAFDRGHADADARRRFVYDGAAVLRGTRLYAFLRSSLTRYPRSYSLGPDHTAHGEKFVLAGEGFEDPARQQPHTHFSVQFIARPQAVIRR